MSTTSTPTKNHLGLEKKDYAGGTSTLCTGCGHDLISSHIITACYQAGIAPYSLAKMSGIGCSSKLPGYFISKSFGFNSMHGRMAPVCTGAKIANHHLTMLGISGDGDSASIGLGGFAHMIRRNVQCAYIVANNGVFGLTKGQFSATADQGSRQKNGVENPFGNIDICGLALELGASFVARSFSGDGKQLVPLIQAALKHKGTAIIDVISPCITFNNHDGSTKSYSYLKEHDVSLQELGYIAEWQETPTVDYAEGTTETINLGDGSKLLLKKLDTRIHNVHDRAAAAIALSQSRRTGEVLTGLFYINEEQASLSEVSNLGKIALADLDESALRPDRSTFDSIMSEFR